jgi:N-acetyl-gamma-glutamyl-phosphate reductase
MKIKVGIIGAAGYTAGELILNHPEAELTQAQSESQVGKYLYEVHKDLFGQTEVQFVSAVNDELLDVVFLCKGHGESKKILESNPNLLELKIIDLSQDFRLEGDHDFVYGLPEVNRKEIAESNHIANPGCFATCIQLGLLPAVNNRLVKSEVHISGITGSTGAGQSFSETSHFSWRSNNASVYKALTHQHLFETGETFKKLDSGFDETVNFIPYRGAFTRGIITTSYFDTDQKQDDLRELYDSFYRNQEFTNSTILNPDLKMVVNTNYAFVKVEVVNRKAVIVSVIDNLLKGASGQAVQNMNLIFGLDEDSGLQLKASAF